MNVELLADEVQACFSEIHRDVFEGDPVSNPNLRVEVVAASEAGPGPVVVVVTPWTVNAMVFPVDTAAEERLPATFRLAGSARRVLANEIEGLGRYLSVNLIPDVSTFTDQDEARAAAAEMGGVFLTQLTAAWEEGSVENPSRRDLFKRLGGGPGSPEPETPSPPRSAEDRPPSRRDELS